MLPFRKYLFVSDCVLNENRNLLFSSVRWCIGERLSCSKNLLHSRVNSTEDTVRWSMVCDSIPPKTPKHDDFLKDMIHRLWDEAFRNIQLPTSLKQDSVWWCISVNSFNFLSFDRILNKTRNMFSLKCWNCSIYFDTKLSVRVLLQIVSSRSLPTHYQSMRISAPFVAVESFRENLVCFVFHVWSSSVRLKPRNISKQSSVVRQLFAAPFSPKQLYMMSFLHSMPFEILRKKCSFACVSLSQTL